MKAGRFFFFLYVFFCGAAGAQNLYWESPAPFSPAAGTFPVSAHNGDSAVLAWQETTRSAGNGGKIAVRLAVKNPGSPWVLRDAPGVYDYSGAEPAILSAAVDRNGRILIAAGASTTQTDIYILEKYGTEFIHYRLDTGSESSVAPRIFARAGGYILFVTRGRGQNLSLYYALSADGMRWSEFRPFVNENSFRFTFLPSMVSLNGTDYAVFQSQVESAFQLFFSRSTDGGVSWSVPRRITDFREENGLQPNQFNNERVHLSVQQGRLFAVWERRASGRSPQIYGAYLNGDGSVSGYAGRINGDEAYCNNPLAVETGSGTAVFWFDNSRGGQRVFMSRRTPGGWERGADLSGPGEAVFARPVRVSSEIFVFWQRGTGNAARVYSLFPDISVTPPLPRAENFTEGRKNRGSLVRIGWNIPEDSSGIAGYSWSWSRRPGDVPPAFVMAGAYQTSLEHTAGEDGPWYFALRSCDRAGNWSETVRLVYARDTIPPAPLTITAPETDENGFLLSNTFDMDWIVPAEEDLAGYTWNLEYLGPAFSAAARFSPAPPPRSILGTENRVSYDNQDNGLWYFSAAAIDGAGNIGEASGVFLKMNKYVSHTFITHVDARQDEWGRLTINIIGRGFADGGPVVRVILDRDGAEPYDKQFILAGGDYRVLSDREIGGIGADDLDQGLYRVVLDHPLRGLYLTPPLVPVDHTGTVKFGDFGRDWKPSWVLRRDRRFVFDAPLAALSAVLVFCVLGFLVSARGIASALRESAAIRLETIALITGDVMPMEKKNRIIRIRRRGAGLRLKLASFTIALVLVVVVMVSGPLYFMMTRTQESTLLKGLWDRSSVLLEGLAASARAHMPLRNFLELGYLPDQSVFVPEARYVTITGYNLEDVHYNHVLATNDPGIGSKIDTPFLEIGISRLTDILSPRTLNISVELNERAMSEVGELSASLRLLLREGAEIVDSGRNATTEGRERLDAISVTTQSLQTRIGRKLSEIGWEIGSEPEFSTASLAANKSETYVFFKPVLYRQSDDEFYFRGLVRLEVGIDSIKRDIAEGQVLLLRVIVIIALAALAIGTLGALALSSLIIRPITRLVSHVERIRDTEDKTRLEGVDIMINSRDEIAILGNTINDMTHGLVEAAAAASDLSLGKEIQKKFIPLDINREGNKLSSGYKDTKNAEFFGYYEGAKGVSGDYFNYQDLDGRYFAIIKCDVAGKGIPAALIMIQVATMFINYFKQWNPSEKGIHFEDVVYQINEFIETLAFKGRFAAFTLCLFDTETGLAHFCNAGDNVIHWYDAHSGRVRTATLKESPATGVLPNFMVESRGGYTIQTINLNHGDVLFLYTDGIEEAKRKFRDAEFREITCTEGEPGTIHETHSSGQGDEELGADRVFAIINAVMNRRLYTLRKHHNPEGEITLAFDFSNCEGKVEEAIMALVSVEKIFRMYKNRRAAADNRVMVDKKIDEFLKRHFLQYRNYCHFTRENQGNDAYMYYTHVQEDEQYDDLTILGIKRK